MAWFAPILAPFIYMLLMMMYIPIVMSMLSRAFVTLAVSVRKFDVSVMDGNAVLSFDIDVNGYKGLLVIENDSDMVIDVGGAVTDSVAPHSAVAYEFSGRWSGNIGVHPEGAGTARITFKVYVCLDRECKNKVLIAQKSVTVSVTPGAAILPPIPTPGVY